jgi:hypothetical protein
MGEISSKKKDQGLDVNAFFLEFESLLDKARIYRCSVLGESRASGHHQSTKDIYEGINARIDVGKRCVEPGNDTVSVPHTSEKKQILDQYFASFVSPRIHVIQGPPGTGKTELSAIYILLFLLRWHVNNPKSANHPKSANPVIVISAFTHKAIDNVLLRIERLFPLFYALALKQNFNEKTNCFPFARMIKLHAQSERSQFKGDTKNGIDEVSEFAPELVFGARNQHPEDDKAYPLGLHDMRVNYSLLDWFLDDNECSSKELLKGIRAFDRPTILGCTTSQLIKLKSAARNTKEPKSPEIESLQVDLLLLDEASMMMLPDFLPLAERVKDDGLLVVVGDDLQLGPISQNDWTREIRPSLNEHKPWNSVFHYLRRMAHPRKKDKSRKKEKSSVAFVCYHDADGKDLNPCIAWSALQTTYRLTPEATELIQPAYTRVDVSLKNPPKKTDTGTSDKSAPDRFRAFDWDKLQPSAKNGLKIDKEGFFKFSEDESKYIGHGVFLITYDDKAGDYATENDHERKIIAELLKNGLIGNDVNKNSSIKQSIAIVTPYHDQIEGLRTNLAEIFDENKVPDWLLIDTVNKLQGDERDVVIFSACVAGTDNLLVHGSFVMELQRTNVAFSRAKKQLIVIASESLLRYIPSDFKAYQASLLWKNLRQLCCQARK